jgi:putative nucleotidyltransferase with HDIG domain
MAMPAFSQLRIRLLVLALLAALPPLVILSLSINNQRTQARRMALDQALGLARVVALGQDRVIEEMDQLLAVAALVPEVRSHDRKTCSSFLSSLLKKDPYTANLGVIEPDGYIYCSALPITEPIYAGDRAYFQRAIASHGFAVGDYIIGRITGIPSINFGYPMYDQNDHLVGVVFVALDLQWLTNLASEAQLPQGSTVTIIDPKGMVLARYPDPVAWIAKSIADTDLYRTIRQIGYEGTVQEAGLDSQLRLYGFTQLSTNSAGEGVTVAVGIPSAVAFAETTTVLWRGIGVVLIVMVIAGVGAWYGSDRFVLRRIYRLLAATRQIADGDLTTRIGNQLGEGEIAEVGRAFDAMALSLELRAAERDLAVDGLREANRVLAMRAECNQILVKAHDERSLLQDLTKAIVEHGGYKMAWVGFARNDSAKTVEPVAWAGDAEGYFDRVEISWGKGMPAGDSPTGRAIQQGSAWTSRSIEDDPLFNPWRDEALARGYHSAIALPILIGENERGALTIFSSTDADFPYQTVSLLTELANDMAYGIISLRARIGHIEAEQRAMLQLERLSALRKIDMAITASLDPRVTFHVLLDQATSQLSVDAADILVLDQPSRTLSFGAGKGFITDALRHTHLRLGEGHAGRAAIERQILIIQDLGEEEGEFSASPKIREEGFVFYCAVPLISKGNVLGVLEAFKRQKFAPEQEWLDFLDSLAGQAAIAIENSALFDSLYRANLDLVNAYDTTLEGWSKALELRDHETQGHTRRVTELTLRLAEKIGIPQAEMEHIRRGALLHDIGKMGVSDSVLLKPGPLNEEEWIAMKRHPVLAFELLSPIHFLKQALDIPYCHHEKWDGSGYPRGLKENEIPIAARAFALADVWDALTSDRPYRKAWSEEKAYQYIREQAGMHFDPDIVKAFLRMMEAMKSRGDDGIHAS